MKKEHDMKCKHRQKTYEVWLTRKVRLTRIVTESAIVKVKAICPAEAKKKALREDGRQEWLSDEDYRDKIRRNQSVRSCPAHVSKCYVLGW